MEKLSGTIYYAPHQNIGYIEKELGRGARRYGSFVFDFEKSGRSVWATDTWQNIMKITFRHEKDGASKLLELAPEWEPVPWTLKETASEIAFHTGYREAYPLKFGPALFQNPPSPKSRFLLRDEKTILASLDTSNPFPLGKADFIEDKKNPPSSAYLKLYEALARLGYYPQKSDRVVDLGASPGGWTWVLAQTGAHVVSVDRAVLHESLMKAQNVQFVKGNAFSYELSGQYDLVASDIICYPRVLWDWFSKAFEKKIAKRYALTIKMQDKPDTEVIELFRSVPGGTVYHGAYNKHELSFIWQEAI